MKTIWKFTLPLADNPKIEMPRGARILSVQTQYDDICLWAAVESTETMGTRGFHVVGTGNPIPEAAGEYLGSVQQTIHSTTYVWHIFEEAKPPAEEDFQKLYETARKWWDQASPETREVMRRVQRRSWATGEMLLEHPEMTRAEVERLVDAADR